MDLSTRIDQSELMDTQRLSYPVMRETLSFLETANRRFGGFALVTRFLNRWSKNWLPGKTIEILDVGTGGADLPVAIAAWAKNRNLQVRITGLDLMDDIVRIAFENSKDYENITIRHGDFFDLVNVGEKYDYVISSLLLHHIPTGQTASALRAFDQLAKRGVIVSDLLRTRAGYWAVRTASYLLGNEIVRHDGPLSVRRAFLPNELEKLAREAGTSYLQAQVEPWFRVSLAGEKSTHLV